MRDVHAGREPDERLPEAISRVMLVEDLACQVGGLYGSGFGSEYADGLPET